MRPAPCSVEAQAVIDADPAMTLREVSTYLGIAWRTGQEWEAKGDFPPRLALPGRVRRYRRSEVDKWLARRGAEGLSQTG